MKKLSFLICLLCLGLQARAQNLAATLTAGVWKVTDLGMDNNGDGVPDVQLWKPCREGSTYTFNNDGTGTYYKGPARCNKNDAGSSVFTWSAAGAGSLSITTNGQSETVNALLSDAQHVVLWFTKSKIRFVMERQP